MPRRSAYGTEYDFDEIAPKDRVYNAARTRMAAWWISGKKSDKFDDDTDYMIALWDVATKERLDWFARGRSVDLRDGTADGPKLKRVKFGPGDTLMLVYEDGSEEPARPERPTMPTHDDKPDGPIDFGPILGKH